MAKSLQEQLLEAGLVDKSRIKQANKARGKQARRNRGKGGAQQADLSDEAKARAQAAEAEKRARDRELNREPRTCMRASLPAATR